jgi:uncharacterized protein YqhQ
MAAMSVLAIELSTRAMVVRVIYLVSSRPVVVDVHVLECQRLLHHCWNASKCRLIELPGLTLALALQILVLLRSVVFIFQGERYR